MSDQVNDGHHHHHHHHNHEEPRLHQPQPQQPIDANVNPANRIGKYQVIKTLGEGSFGKVKLAQHLTTGQRVALKIINRKTLAKSDMQGRVEREISYLRLLRHPHIIKLYDVIKSKDEIIMVIEFAGKELFDYIVQTGKMPENEARRFFQQIIAAVEYCHRHKIVHRDLKPENLLLDDQLNVKIADFGLSNIMTDGNFLKTSCGSPNYAAPEVISGKLYAGPEVDVWSLGVILYVMLCGRLPFDDEFIPALFKKISNGVYTLPNYLSQGAKNLLTKMLVVNPLNRITIHEIMEDEWFKQDIQDYLLPPDLSKTKYNKVETDENVINALNMTMGYDRDEIIKVIEDCNKHRHPQQQSNEVLDAYLLMKENHSLVADLKKNKTEKMDNFLSQSPPPLWNTLNTGGATSNTSGSSHRSPGVQQSVTYQTLATVPDLSTLPNSTIAILPSSLPSIHRAYMMENNINNQNKISPVSLKKLKTRWHFGVRSRSYPLDVMGEIYRALKNLGAEWLKPTEEELWTIRVRWKYGPTIVEDDPNCEIISPDMMKMQIQLFQLEPNNYLVDFKFDGWESSIKQQELRLQKQASSNSIPKEKNNQDVDEMSSFSAYPFLHLATRLIMELAVNSQNS
ncbi:carbon catabolite derepressing ser/thr protein kinase [Hyphopichia burtonii NRRL Y-1933]|uniref:Carbon catabolite-derepressing protein kinase n=1 Tax=Hyphopichia burtonii NRRL Y-1933 TaxID=984485 RepID=A0A1E4RIL1_9ASCO|nr:carbon catabolite derepressing ser/thr protein kinase [Hyphopichia burtonii NRRL Y-1933]ODV67070.1 carbon catabolite derepressing ser/thr protein kinase [Hyphopichia burtonii NRRL Y-1933]